MEFNFFIPVMKNPKTVFRQTPQDLELSILGSSLDKDLKDPERQLEQRCLLKFRQLKKLQFVDHRARYLWLVL